MKQILTQKILSDISKEDEDYVLESEHNSASEIEYNSPRRRQNANISTRRLAILVEEELANIFGTQKYRTELSEHRNQILF